MARVMRSQQLQPLELHQCAALGAWRVRRLGAQIGVGRLERRGARGHARFQRLVAGLQFAFGAHASRRVDGAHLREAEQQVAARPRHAEVRHHGHLAGGLRREYSMSEWDEAVTAAKHGERVREAVAVAPAPVADDRPESTAAAPAAGSAA